MEWMGQGLRDERAPAWGRTRKRPEGLGGAGLREPSVCPAPAPPPALAPPPSRRPEPRERSPERAQRGHSAPAAAG